MMNPLSIFYTIRGYVDAYAGLIGRRLLSLIWVVALCILVWFWGSTLNLGGWRPLVSVENRLIAIGVIVAAWLVFLVVGFVRKRRADKKMIDDLAAEGGEVSADAEHRAEIAELRGRLREALTLLRKVVKRRFGYVYELPWYLIVGAPGSGKTTLLKNSGLQFPVGDALAGEPLEGVGGTKNCSWWFAEEAILIDTAGRYTTHADFKGTDKAGWLGFLKLLKRHRPSQPVNGIIVTLSIGDLLHQNADDRLTEIRAIRQRLTETDETLRARVPVYVVLTKADLLTGFAEFFDGLSRTDREQVWGMTFDLRLGTKGKESVADAFGREFDLLLQQLQTLLIERLQQEPDLETRGRMFKFPAEVASLRDDLVEVLAELASSSKLVNAPLIRGVYLTCGSQDGIAAVAQAERPRRRASSRTLQRSYFLTRLFSGVMFEEAALVARDIRLMRRRVVIRRAGYAVIALVAVAGLLSFASAYVRHAVALDAADDAMTRYRDLSAGIPTKEVADADFLRVLPALDALAAARQAFSGGLVPITFGLGMADVVERQHDAAYHRALNALMLPRLLVAARDVMTNPQAGDREKFDALKLYLMLGSLGPLDAGEVETRADALFATLYPGAGREPARAKLGLHVQQLVSEPLQPIALDADLIAAVRAEIGDRTFAERAHDLLTTSDEAVALAPWRPTEVLTSAGQAAFDRRSGEPLRDGVAGVYTADGLQQVVLPGLMPAAEAALAEDWVRGVERDANLSASAVARDEMEIYFNGFREAWRSYLSDLRVKPAATVGEASEIARALAASPPPVEMLARSIARATDVTGDYPDDAEGAVAKRQALLALYATSPIDVADVPDPYADLRRALLAEADQPSQVEAFRKPLERIYEQLALAASGSAGVVEIFRVDGALAEANQAMIGEARRLPAPLGQWMGGFAADVASLSIKTARGTIAEEWEASGAKLCTAAIEGRYPIDRTSEQDVALADFTTAFAPGGLFDTFFKERLAGFVDTTTDPWSWRGGLGTQSVGTAELSADPLRSFQNAAAIRDAFFGDGAEMAFTFEVTPVAGTLSTNASAVQLELGDQRVTYFSGPVSSRTIEWPDPSGASQARVGFQPGGWEAGLTRGGPWAPLRLLDAAQTARQPDGAIRATFAAADRTATFDVKAGAVANPFDLPALGDFRCPSIR